MLYFQADGLCNALRLGVQLGQTPGPKTTQFLIGLTKAVRASCSGDPIDRLIDITNDSSVIDMLVAAEILRSTIHAFLTPEELEEQRKSIGFSDS